MIERRFGSRVIPTVGKLHWLPGIGTLHRVRLGRARRCCSLVRWRRRDVNKSAERLDSVEERRLGRFIVMRKISPLSLAERPLPARFRSVWVGPAQPGGKSGLEEQGRNLSANSDPGLTVTRCDKFRGARWDRTGPLERMAARRGLGRCGRHFRPRRRDCHKIEPDCQ